MTELQQQPAQEDVIRYAGIAYRAQKDGVAVFDLLQAIRWHHFSGFQIIFTAPGIMGKFKAEAAVQFRDGIQHLDGFPDDLRPDPVSGDDGYAKGFQCVSLLKPAARGGSSHAAFPCTNL